MGEKRHGLSLIVPVARHFDLTGTTDNRGDGIAGPNPARIGGKGER
jgi:hypothetical protein